MCQRVDAYDGTLSAMKVHYIGKVAPFLNVTRSNFHNLSWVPYAKRAVPVVTMLKMDCEGCEVTALPSFLDRVCAENTGHALPRGVEIVSDRELKKNDGVTRAHAWPPEAEHGTQRDRKPHAHRVS